MRRAHVFILLGLAFLASGVAAAAPAPGLFRLDEGSEAAGGLELRADGRFAYALALGALDEHAEGRWEWRDGTICLFTEPTPVPPAFARAEPGEATDPAATLLVSWPGGEAIAGIDFRMGLDDGSVIEGYTQYDGWSLPDNDARRPLWIEVSEPIHRIGPVRFELEPADRARLRLTLIPNDLGVVNFEDACLDETADGVLFLHRGGGVMRFTRISAPSAVQ